jgi:beta-glucosidase
MLNHYGNVIDACRRRGLTPIVTFNHFSVPRWFAALGGWTHHDAPKLFARYCDRAARRLAPGIGYATTLNQPNMMRIMAAALPPAMMSQIRTMNLAAARASGSENFKTAMLPEPADIPVIERNLLAAHKAAREAIKAVRGDLAVGVSLTVTDDQAVGDTSLRDARREENYGGWLDTLKEDDFVGVQNYSRTVWGHSGSLPPPEGATLNAMGAEVYAPSLAGAVRYVHARSGLPVLVTEHGVNTPDDRIRARLIPAALLELQRAIADGVPVLGYIHWTLVDNFEWIFGYSANFGLCSVDRETFYRIPKPSAGVLRSIARQNAV